MELPFITERIPGTGGTIKTSPEDFRVEEIPLYPLSGEGEHLFLLIEKKGITTLQAVEETAAHFGVETKDVGYAGLKDARAVTRQYLSIPCKAAPERVTVVSENLKILSSNRHNNKLRKGHLAGNRFWVTVRGIEKWNESSVAEILETLHERGVPNYFGPQRFGSTGKNDLAGLDILRGKKRGGRNRGLMISALQSRLFNEALARRIGEIDALREGDLAFIHSKGAVFDVTDPEAEMERCRTFEISPSGPIFGYKMKSPSSVPLEIEENVLEGWSLAKEDFKRTKTPGARRPFRVRAEMVEYKRKGSSAEFRFALPAGSYATSFMREITKTEDAAP